MRLTEGKKVKKKRTGRALRNVFVYAFRDKPNNTAVGYDHDVNCFAILNLSIFLGVGGFDFGRGWVG